MRELIASFPGCRGLRLLQSLPWIRPILCASTARMAVIHQVPMKRFYRWSIESRIRVSTKRGADALARGFADENPRWDEVELKPLDVDAPAFAALVQGLEKAGFVVQTYFCFGNWYLEVKGRSFAQYVETLPSVLRNTLGRKKKKLEKSGRAQIEIVTGGDGLESAI